MCVSCPVYDIITLADVVFCPGGCGGVTLYAWTRIMVHDQPPGTDSDRRTLGPSFYLMIFSEFMVLITFLFYITYSCNCRCDDDSQFHHEPNERTLMIDRPPVVHTSARVSYVAVTPFPDNPRPSSSAYVVRTQVDEVLPPPSYEYAVRSPGVGGRMATYCCYCGKSLDMQGETACSGCRPSHV